MWGANLANSLCQFGITETGTIIIWGRWLSIIPLLLSLLLQFDDEAVLLLVVGDDDSCLFGGMDDNDEVSRCLSQAKKAIVWTV